jgi:hypothetical protein
MIITTRKRTNIARYLQKLCQFYAVLQTPDVVTQQYAPKQLKIRIQTKGQYSCTNEQPEQKLSCDSDSYYQNSNRAR